MQILRSKAPLRISFAGGGGYILLFCDVARRAQVAKAVAAAGGRGTEFALETAGLQSWSVLSPH